MSATARLNPNVNVKAIVIGIMDRLSNYASREAEVESVEERVKKEEAAAEKLLAKLTIQDNDKANDTANTESTPAGDANGQNSESQPQADNEVADSETTLADNEETTKTLGDAKPEPESVSKEEVKQTKGIPEDIKLYEIFYEQVLNLVNVRAHTRQFGQSSADSRADFHVSSKAHNLPVQDIIALLVSLANLALKIYPERLGE